MRLPLRSGSEKCVLFIIISRCCWPALVTRRRLSHLSKKRRFSAGRKRRSVLRQKNTRERRRGPDMASSISKRSRGKKSGSLAHSLGLARNFSHCCRRGTPGARRVKTRSCSRRTRMEAAEVAALRERFQNMKIVARAKVTRDRVYSAAYHPDPTTDLIFFGGECTTLRV
jgi:hypothetical protein